jgi:hypothetical protein
MSADTAYTDVLSLRRRGDMGDGDEVSDMKLYVGAAIAFVSLLEACGGSTQSLSDASAGGDANSRADAGGQDVGAGADALPFDAGDLSPIPGGGATGGPINGHLTVFAIDQASGMPVPGATLIAAVDAKTFTGMTDAKGRVDLNDPGLVGPLTIHLFARGYTYQTEIGVNAAQITLALQPPNRTSTAAIARISGNVGGWDMLPALTSTRTNAHFGTVTAISKSFLGTPNISQDVRPGGGIPTNVAIENVAPNYIVKVDAIHHGAGPSRRCAVLRQRPGLHAPHAFRAALARDAGRGSNASWS